MNRHRRHREQLRHPSLGAIHGDNDAAFVPVARAMVVKWMVVASALVVCNCSDPPARYTLRIQTGTGVRVVEQGSNGKVIQPNTFDDMIREAPTLQAIEPIPLVLFINGIETSRMSFAPDLCGRNCGIACSVEDVAEEYSLFLGIADPMPQRDYWFFSNAECKMRDGRVFSFAQ